MKTLHFINAQLPSGEHSLLVKDGKIVALNPVSVPDDAEVLDCNNKWLIPGGVDVHTHFGMPLRDGITSTNWLESGKQALLGGTTTVIDFANPDSGESLSDAVQRWHKYASDTVIDYGLHVTIADPSDNILAEIPQLIESGLPTFKGFLAYKDRLMLTETELEKVMVAVRDAGGKLLVHCEDGDLNEKCQNELIEAGKTAPKYHPLAHLPESESNSIASLVKMQKKTDCPTVVVHLSTERGLDHLVHTPIEREVCIGHLLLEDSIYKTDDAIHAICSPPIRSKKEMKAMQSGLIAGQIHWIATDHCEFDSKLKKQEAKKGFHHIPNGIAGVEQRMLMTWMMLVKPGKLTAMEWVELCCVEPAQRMGLAGIKGDIAPGYDADLVVFDPDIEAITNVWLRGEMAVEDGELVDSLPVGKFLKRSL
jgi:dihydropyrimidinase